LSTTSENRPSVPGKPLAATMAAVKQQQLQQLQMQQQQQNIRTSLPNFNLNKEDMGNLTFFTLLNHEMSLTREK
jgi:hypothetical protein